MKNEERRNEWIEKQLKSIPDGLRILDAGAGELRWKSFAVIWSMFRKIFVNIMEVTGRVCRLRHGILLG